MLVLGSVVFIPVIVLPIIMLFICIVKLWIIFISVVETLIIVIGGLPGRIFTRFSVLIRFVMN